MKKKRTAWDNQAGKDRIQNLEEESAQIEAMSEMERIKKIAGSGKS